MAVLFSYMAMNKLRVYVEIAGLIDFASPDIGVVPIGQLAMLDGKAIIALNNIVKHNSTQQLNSSYVPGSPELHWICFCGSATTQPNPFESIILPSLKWKV